MKNKNFISSLIIIILFSSCKGQTKEEDEKNSPAFTNELIKESSPYLLQHAHNPVNWYPWGEKALEKAKKENKLVIISIGYAACHWCHVMEHESFEDVEVANYMNEHFVCIKVDREERPDVDQIYMTASQLINGSGGWPLNALALPNGEPFFAGTYYPKENWLKLLAYFVNIKNKNPESLKEQAQKLTEGIKGSEYIELVKEKSSISKEDLDLVFKKWKPSIDFKKGGENRAPKFPMPSNWEYLMQYYNLTKNKEALRAVTTTLNNMAFGGIYDQIGGGFSRYSTDVNWKAPHFEKMLYDNAQLVSLYCHAYQLTKEPLYKKVVYETLNFIETELTSSETAFYSSLDADSEGEEGKYYVWTYKEIESILGSETNLFADYYNIRKGGNWEKGTNILYRKDTNDEFAKKHDLSIEKLQTKIKNSTTILLKERFTRIKPQLDDKIITAWNSLMLTGYVDAYRAFGEEKYLNKAIKNADFLLKNVISNENELTRNFKNGKATIPAFLDDYAFTISAFINLYQATFEEKWLYKAKELTNYTVNHFFDSETGMFFYTNKNYSNLIARKMEIADNVIPSSNSEMAKNLFKLSLYFEEKSYAQKAKQMFTNVQKDANNNIRYYSNWGILEISLVKEPYEVAIIGSDFQKVRKTLDQNYLPNVIFLGGRKEGSLPLLRNKLMENETYIYVCQNKACKLPTKDSKEALNQINNP